MDALLLLRDDGSRGVGAAFGLPAQDVGNPGAVKPARSVVFVGSKTFFFFFLRPHRGSKTNIKTR